MESNWKFQRGDIYFVKLEAGVGSEQNGARPAVILQNDVGNIYSPTLIVAALTSKTDKKVTQATHCQVEEDGLKPSIVQAEQIFTIDKSRVLKFVGHLSPENMRRVDDAVKISLALNPMGSIQKHKPIIRSQAAYAPPEVVDGKPPIYPYTPIKSSFEDAGSVEGMMMYTELQSAVHAMIQRLEFAESKGWVIVHEEQEEGVSGHKVRAAARDKLQIIKDYARRGKFDILLVFMFDRIGRIADETPFVVEWFVRNGIRVWSTQEGEQRFDNHTDKLLNYIRFWQADGESEKTSVRTRTSLRQLVEEGHFKGGNAPYGYDLVKSGRINKRKHELYELHINEQEAEIVRLIFDKYVYEGYGAQRIATYLNNAGYRARSGKCWHPGSLRGMVGNLTYMGVLRCGDARSELMPELQIIPQEEFEAAQRIREDRSAHAAEEAEHHVPLRTRGQALLSNNVYCGHCGARLALTTSRKWRKLPDGTLDDTLRIRYTCYGKLRKQTECTGQTGYTMHILDEIIDKMVREIFSRLRGIPKEQLIISRYAKETAERKNHLQALQAERDKAEKDLLALKAEILAVIKGESAFPKDTLAEMIAAQEKKHTELETLCEEASAELERNAELMANVSQLYEELISYADLYDSASFEAKKMIVSQLIRRIDVYRGYQIHVDFNFDLAQYLENSDELAC